MSRNGHPRGTPDIERVGQLRVQVARVLEDVRVVCGDSEEVTSENQIASKRDASEDQEARKGVMPGVLGAISEFNK